MPFIFLPKKSGRKCFYAPNIHKICNLTIDISYVLKHIFYSPYLPLIEETLDAPLWSLFKLFVHQFVAADSAE